MTSTMTTSQPQQIQSPNKVAFSQPAYVPERGSTRRLSGRRGSTISSTSTEDSTASSGPHEQFEQDWTTTTADKDTWASRERRKSSIFHKIDAFPSIAPKAVHPTPHSPTSPSMLSVSPRERRGSILSLWTHGKDHDGHAVLHSDDHGVWVEEVKEAKRLKDMEEEASETKEEAIQKGSILSMWKKGKDENGKDVILSGDLDEDEVLRQQQNEEAARLKADKIARLRKQMEQLRLELEAEEGTPEISGSKSAIAG